MHSHFNYISRYVCLMGIAKPVLYYTYILFLVSRQGKRGIFLNDRRQYLTKIYERMDVHSEYVIAVAVPVALACPRSVRIIHM